MFGGVHKSGVRTSVSHFRPITTYSTFPKIFEKLVHSQIISFLDKYNLINNNQFCLQKGKNTSNAILEFLDHAYDSLNNKQYILAIFFDFSRAFDTISFDFLSDKLNHISIRGFMQWGFAIILIKQKAMCLDRWLSLPCFECWNGVPKMGVNFDAPSLHIIY